MKRHRVIATAAVIAAVVLGIIFVPLPHHVRCTVEISPRDAEPVYAVTPGLLRQISVRPGDRVSAGTTLAKLENIDLALSVENLRGKRQELQTQRDGLRRQMIRNAEPGLEIRQVTEMLGAVEQQLKEKEEELQRLDLVAPVSGVVLPPPVKPSRPEPDGKLPTWTGTPFDPQNRGAVMASGETICRIGDEDKLEAILIVDQADIDFIKKGNPVRVKLDAHPFNTFKSSIAEVSSSDLKITPMALSAQAGGELDTKTDASGMQRPLSTSYQARAPLDDPQQLLAIGMRGKGKIKAGWMPLGRRMYRYLARTFHFEL